MIEAESQLRDRASKPGDVHGPTSMRLRPISNLSERVITPAADGPATTPHTRMVRSYLELDRVSNPGDFHWGRAELIAPVAQLPKVALTPATDSAIAEQNTAMVRTAAEINGGGNARHCGGYGSVPNGASPSELP